MSRKLAIAQILLGLLGLLCCIVVFIRFAHPMKVAVAQLGELAESTQAELDLTMSIANDGEQVLSSFQLASETNRDVLHEATHSLDEICGNLVEWKKQLESLSLTAREASRVTGNFAEVLPLQIPVLTYRMEKQRVTIPTITLKEQSVELPYPTAKLGSRKETIDLGVTELDFKVPTLEVGTSMRQVTVPATPDVQLEDREFNIPSDFTINKQPVLAQEKQVLERVSRDLENVAAGFIESAATMSRIESLASNELQASLEASKSALSVSIDQLENLKSVRLPDFQRRLKEQHQQLGEAQPVFRELGRSIPWVFALFSLLPIGMVIQGLWMLNRSAGV